MWAWVFVHTCEHNKHLWLIYLAKYFWRISVLPDFHPHTSEDPSNKRKSCIKISDNNYTDRFFQKFQNSVFCITVLWTHVAKNKICIISNRLPVFISNRMKWSEVKWSEVKWSEVKWSEVKWSEVKGKTRKKTRQETHGKAKVKGKGKGKGKGLYLELHQKKHGQ